MLNGKKKERRKKETRGFRLITDAFFSFFSQRVCLSKNKNKNKNKNNFHRSM
jgi:hypothetical protein